MLSNGPTLRSISILYAELDRILCCSKVILKRNSNSKIGRLGENSYFVPRVDMDPKIFCEARPRLVVGGPPTSNSGDTSVASYAV